MINTVRDKTFQVDYVRHTKKRGDHMKENGLLQAIAELLDQKLEEKLEQKLEEKLDQKLEEKLDKKLDEKLQPIYDHLEQIDERLDRVDERFDKVEYKLDQNYGMLEEFYVYQKETNTTTDTRVKSVEDEIRVYKKQTARKFG